MPKRYARDFRRTVCVRLVAGEGGRLAAVLDFGTVGLGDPAIDLIPAWTLFDEEGSEVFRNTLAVDDANMGARSGLRLPAGDQDHSLQPGHASRFRRHGGEDRVTRPGGPGLMESGCVVRVIVTRARGRTRRTRAS